MFSVNESSGTVSNWIYKGNVFDERTTNVVNY